MIEIVITTKKISCALLYELRNLQGRRAYVPAYLATTYDTRTGDKFEFAVTRSASRLVFGSPTDQYGSNGECPPSKADIPYKAFVSATSKGSFCLRLFETDEPQQHNTIKGQGEVDRVNIMIHKGPSMSEGCLVIAGGKRGHNRFERWFKARLADDVVITVAVLPFP